MSQKDPRILELQRRVGTKDDGIWGSKSTEAAREHLRRLTPKVNPWPARDEASLLAFYGKAGDESQLAYIDVKGLGVRFGSISVDRIRAHKKCAASLLRIVRKLAALDKTRYLLERFEGVYNYRNMRGLNVISLHARGAAIDLHAAANGNSTPWPTVATMPIEAMEIFAEEGWLCAGAEWKRDAMHFQATR